MNARELLLIAQTGNKEYQELLSEVKGLLSSTPEQLSNSIAENQKKDINKNLPVPLDRNLIVDIALQFHYNAGTLTDEVKSNLELFILGKPIIRIAHQPNIFAYMGVYAQFIYLNQVANQLINKHSINCSQINLLIDFDEAGEKRFRQAKYPDLQRKEELFFINAPISKKDFHKFMFMIEKPTSIVIEKWIMQLKNAVKNLPTLSSNNKDFKEDYGKRMKIFSQVEEEIWDSNLRATTLSEFNSFFLSKIINNYWKLPTIFFPSSKLLPFLGKYHEFLLSRYTDIRFTCENIVTSLKKQGIIISNSIRMNNTTFPFWFKCTNCNTRVPMVIRSKSRYDIFGICENCQSKYAFNLGSFENPNTEEVQGNLVPRVIFDILTDIVGWRISGGTGYIGAAESSIVAGICSSRLNWPVPPECLWTPKGIYDSPIENNFKSLIKDNIDKSQKEEVLEMIENGKISILYYIITLGFDELLSMWNSHFNSNKRVYDICKNS
jgi:hypothetical protein